MQPDGKLLVSAAYYVFPDKENFFTLRTTPEGQLDDTFADGGVFAADLAPDAGVYSEAETITLQPDGKIVIAGRSKRTDEFLVDLAVVRLLNGGGPDDVIFADQLRSGAVIAPVQALSAACFIPSPACGRGLG